MKLFSTSTEWVPIAVKATKPDGSQINPTSDTVQFAFLQGNEEPSSSTTWNAGTWFSGQTPTGSYVAQILVGPGPGGLVLAIGTYTIWIKVTDSPEIPVKECGPLVIQ